MLIFFYTVFEPMSRLLFIFIIIMYNNIYLRSIRLCIFIINYRHSGGIALLRFRGLNKTRNQLLRGLLLFC